MPIPGCHPERSRRVSTPQKSLIFQEWIDFDLSGRDPKAQEPAFLRKAPSRACLEGCGHAWALPIPGCHPERSEGSQRGKNNEILRPATRASE